MADSIDDGTIMIPAGNTLRDLFPGYYPPGREERRDAYSRGLVSLDANALLDLYRYSETARNKFFEILEALKFRLFITHQAAREFYRNRLSVVETRLAAAEEKCKEVRQPLKTVIERVQEFANRHQIGEAERERLIKLVDDLSVTLTESIKAAGTYDLTRESVRAATDVVLGRLESLTAGRVGSALSDAEYGKELKEAARRIEEKIPPGYAEKKTSPELQAGDYILWRQLLNEASLHEKPVLLITDEQKEDWVLKGVSGQILGPRPELVLEMQREARSLFQIVSVAGLLKEAPEFLGITVSTSTIQEAESISRREPLGYQFVGDTWSKYEALSPAEQVEFLEVVSGIGKRITSGQSIENPPMVSGIAGKENLYLLRWSPEDRAIVRVDYDSDGSFDTTIIVSQITKRQSANHNTDTALGST